MSRSRTAAATVPVRQCIHLLGVTMLHGGLVIPMFLPHALRLARVSLLKHAMDHLDIQFGEFRLLHLTRIVDCLRRIIISDNIACLHRLFTLSLPCLLVELGHATPPFCFFCRLVFSFLSQFCRLCQYLPRALQGSLRVMQTFKLRRMPLRGCFRHLTRRAKGAGCAFNPSLVVLVHPPQLVAKLHGVGCSLIRSGDSGFQARSFGTKLLCSSVRFSETRFRLCECAGISLLAEI
mmetsp:Transcript_1841/g.8261  ORF Transcript_1841/g.8261 Transcript_1841/m.8261 type:complete len:235 (+) Transcript_1841:461-1165(+)